MQPPISGNRDLSTTSYIPTSTEKDTPSSVESPKIDTLATDVLLNSSQATAPKLQRNVAKKQLVFDKSTSQTAAPDETQKALPKKIQRSEAKLNLLPTATQKMNFLNMVGNIAIKPAPKNGDSSPIISSSNSQPSVKTAKVNPQSMKYEELNRNYLEGTDNKIQIGKYTMIGVGGQGVDKSAFAEFSKGGNSVNTSGWKAHLSIHPDQLGKAWDIVSPILEESQCQQFKVCRSNAQMNKLHDIESSITELTQKLAQGNINQSEKESLEFTKNKAEQGKQDLARLMRGMQITLYIPHGKEVEYNKILETIEQALQKEGINPGTVDKSDRQIGQYASIRHEGTSGYKSHDQVTSYNPDNVPDPFRSSLS